MPLPDVERFVPIAKPEAIHMAQLHVRLFRYARTIQVRSRDAVQIFDVKLPVAGIEEDDGVPLVNAGRVDYDVTLLAANEDHPR